MPVETINDLAADEVKLWEDMLKRQGLSMETGHNPKWLTYTPVYHETDKPFDYTDTEKRKDARGGRRDGAGRPKS